jgi:HSP20 family molecular chaperone IbpA
MKNRKNYGEKDKVY